METTRIVDGISLEAGILILLGLAVLILTWILVCQGRKKAAPEIIVRKGLTVYCKNVGKETAYNLSFDKVVLNVFTIFFQPVPVIEPGEEVKFGYWIEGNNEESKSMIEAFGVSALDFPFFERMKVNWYPITLSYEDKEQKKYKRMVRVDCTKRRIDMEKVEKV